MKWTNFKIIFFILSTSLILWSCDFTQSMSDEECTAVRTNHKIEEVIETGDILVLKDFVGCGLDINEPVMNNVMPLFAAAYIGHTDMVEFLLSEGAEVDAGYNSDYEIEDKRNGGNTALIAAIIRDRDDVAKILLDHGADMYAREASVKYKALTLAATEGSEVMLGYFLDNGGDPTLETRVGKLIDFISKMGKEHSVALLLKNKQVADSRHGSIHIAAQEGHLETVKALINVGDDLDHNSSFLGSGLRGATNTNKQDVMKLLISRGADLNHHTTTGTTSLMLAAKRGHIGAVEILVSSGADVDYADQDDKTALMFATENNFDEIVEILSTP